MNNELKRELENLLKRYRKIEIINDGKAQRRLAKLTVGKEEIRLPIMDNVDQSGFTQV